MFLIAIGLFDDVAQMNADAEFDPALARHAGVALDEAALHFNGAAHRVDHAAELNEAAVAGAFDDTPAMRVDGQIAAQPPEPRQGAILVGAGEPAVADHIGDQDCRNFPGLAHSSGSPALRRPSNRGRMFGPVSINFLTVRFGLRRRASAKAVFASSILPSSARAAVNLK